MANGVSHECAAAPGPRGDRGGTYAHPRRATGLGPAGEFARGSAPRGAALSADVERTVRFYQGHPGVSAHRGDREPRLQGFHPFLLHVGNGNLLAFFDFPGLDLGPYAEVLGGLHHLAISVDPTTWERLRERLDAAGVDYEEESGTSLTSATPTAPASNSSPSPWARCTATQCVTVR